MNETESGSYQIQLRNVITSLREDVNVSQNSEHHVRMGRTVTTRANGRS